MAPRALRNKDGFTLVEVLVSLVILACGLLVSLFGIMASVDHVLMNEMRNEAVKLAQERSEQARNMPYQNIKDIVTPQTVNRQIRKTLVPFTVSTVSNPVGSPSASGMTMVQTTVTWQLKNNPLYSFNLQTIVRQRQ